MRAGSRLLAAGLLAALLPAAAVAQGVASGGQSSAPAVSDILKKSGERVDARVFSGANPQLAEPVLRRLDEMQPLPPRYKDMQDQVVPDGEALARALGLPMGPRRATDLTGRTPTPGEITDALK